LGRVFPLHRMNLGPDVAAGVADLMPAEMAR
jgi:hypothetical protein